MVLEEARQGDPEHVQARLQVLANIPVVYISPTARLIASVLLKKKALPAKAAVDALHIAIAAANRTQFLLTWNFRHIANAQMRGKIEAILRGFDIDPPLLCTPDQLLGDKS